MIEDRVETVGSECAHAGELCGPAMQIVNDYLAQAAVRLGESHQRKLSRAIYTEREKSLVLCSLNAVVTVIVLLVASCLLVSYSYHFRGYFAIGGEYIAIALIGGLMPLNLYWLEQHWMRQYD